MQSTVIESTIAGRKWAIVCVYRPPTLRNSTFIDEFTVAVDRLHVHFDNIIVVGDLNYDLTQPAKSEPLRSVCDIFDFSNVIKQPTCFTKNAPPSLVDVILTNRPTLLYNVTNFSTGISDWHNLISVVIKGMAPPPKVRKLLCRSYRHFDEESFSDAVGAIPFHVAYVFDDLDDIYWAHATLLLDIIDEHAPIREKSVKAKLTPFMNSQLRKASFKKAMMFNKYKQCQTATNWELYRIQRNLVTKLKRQSIRNYFHERCAGGPKSKDFWPTVKPFLSNKGLLKDPVIILSEDSNIISDQTSVAGILNDFHINVANDIGTKLTPKDIETHPSVNTINETVVCPVFSFKPTTAVSIHALISKSSSKKATGVDGISAKLLKSCSNTIAQPIADLINFSVATSQFPDRLKQANVVPVFKKKDPLDKQNYRPVSILPSISKLFERTINDQLSAHFENIFNPFLFAFRPGMGCQSTLLRLMEDWRQALDRHDYAAAILMDLSKAFDCLPHDLLLGKLRAYGLTTSACALVRSYLSNRKQRVKLGPHYSEWANTSKGVPQGSILGPLLFKVFINDIFNVLNKSTLYNYADDNTLSYSHHNAETLIQVLQCDCSAMLQWFDQNQMKANPDKFQAISFGKRGNRDIPHLSCESIHIPCEDSVSLLGVNFDHLLTFNNHINDICKKAARQLAVLKRIGHFLTVQGKLTIYKSFIMSNFNYCPLIWHFCSKANTNKL